jgi:hypothetical protein
MVVLNRMEDLPTMMTITKLLAIAPRQVPSPAPSNEKPNVLKIHCLRLMELTQRTSAVMKVSERYFDRLDPVINVFRTFGKLNEVYVTAKMSIVPDDSFSDTVYYQGLNERAEMVIVPWTSHLAHLTGSNSTVFQDEFIKRVLDKVESHVSVMIDTNLHMDDEGSSEPSLSRSISVTSLRNRATRLPTSTSEIEGSPILQLQEGYHVFLPYFGGRDDRIAFMMAVQLLHCPDVKVTVVRIQYAGEIASGSVAAPVAAHTKDNADVTESIPKEKAKSPIASVMSSTMHKMVRFPHLPDVPTSTPISAVETNPDSVEDEQQFNAILNLVPADIKSRLTVETITTNTPLQYAVQRAQKLIEINSTNYHLVIVGRGTKFLRSVNINSILRNDLRDMIKGGQSDMVGKSCLGDAGEAMLLGRISGGLLVVQSSGVEDA